MSLFIRAMEECKDILSNKRYAEGSIAEAYLVSKSVRYVIQYIPNSQYGNHNITHKTFLDKDEKCSDEGPLLDGKVMMLRHEQFIQIHRWVLFHLKVNILDGYYREYHSLQSCSRGKGKLVSKKKQRSKHNSQFGYTTR